MDWPDDVIGLADALGLGAFTVLGISGGGPYAAVCAARIPERLHAVGIVGGVGPPGVALAGHDERVTNRFVRDASRRAPWLIGVPLRVAVRMMNRDPAAFFDRLARGLPEPDRAVLVQPRYQEWLRRSATEAIRAGVRGAVLDTALCARPWGFALADITIPAALWHGERDANVPPAMGRHVAATIPTCTARFSPHDGHASMLVNNLDAILATLLGAGSSTA